MERTGSIFLCTTLGPKVRQMKKFTRSLVIVLLICFNTAITQAQVMVPQKPDTSRITNEQKDRDVHKTGLGNRLGSILDSKDDTVLDKRRITPMVYYSNPDRVFAGVKFRIARGRLGNNPHGFDQSLQLRYSISQNAFSILYNAELYRLIGKWDLDIKTYYDWVVWTNYFGLGNETPMTGPISYYRLSTGEYAANIGINRLAGNYNYLELTSFLQGIEVFNKPNTYVGDNIIGDSRYYAEHRLFAGIHGGYTYQRIDDHILPTRGIMLYAGAGYTWNTYNAARSFANLSGIAQFYIPLIPRLSLSVRAGASGITGTPEFYQYASVGGPMTLRGYHRDRYWGRIGFYNANDLRYIIDFRIKKYTSQVGLVALFDDGRVWMDNENSNTLHYAYGGGLLLSPAHKFTAYATYAVSPEGGLLQFKITKLLHKVPVTRSRQAKN